jgi:RNA-directed DNA polymerase
MSARVKQSSLGFIRYADDFVVMHKQKEVIYQAKSELEHWLKDIGLELKPSKTRVVHSDRAHSGTPPGFDFLGFNIRRYAIGKRRRGKLNLDAKLLIKPSKDSIKKHNNELKQTLSKTQTTEAVVTKINSVVRGWCNYFRIGASKQVFGKFRHMLFEKLLGWARKKHPRRPVNWIYENYFKHSGNIKLRVFGVWVHERRKPQFMHVLYHNTYGIQRHVKVQNTRSVFDGDRVYWSLRLQKIAGPRECGTF